MDYSKLCNEILNLDSKIRYAGVYNTISGKVYEKISNRIERFIDKEQTNSSIIQAYMRWKTRQHFSSAIGEPIYAMTKYTKINRITLPCGKNGLLMVSTESDLEPHKIVNNIIELLEKYADSADYMPRQPTLNF